MDLDAVLARKPEVALVDELAHTNAPGSRHAKRWQDVEELLDAGIDVISTVNVQHLESLNDVVERITGVRQRETVPDEVVRRAEQLELVDITPEALRRRLAHGNVYAAEKVDAALANYFQPGNLTALRELALLWVADEVDVAVQRYRTEQNVQEVWETRERVVVALTGDKESETVLRRAARIAKRPGQRICSPCTCCAATGWSAPRRRPSPKLRRLAEDVGASFHTVVGGEDVPTALLDFARGANATQLVLGTSRRSRLARMFVEGVGTRVAADSGTIDVHMVTHDEAGRGLRLPALHGSLSQMRKVLGLGAGRRAAGRGDRPGCALRMRRPVHRRRPVLPGHGRRGAGGRARPGVPGGAAGRAAAQLLPHPAAVLVHDRRAGERRRRSARWWSSGCWWRWSSTGRPGARSRPSGRARRRRCSPRSPAPCSPAPTRCPRLLEKVRESFGLSSVALLERRRATSGAASPRRARSGAPTPEEADVDVAVEDDLHLVGSGGTLAAADRRLLEVVGGQALLALRSQRAAAQAEESRRRAEATETAQRAAVGGRPRPAQPAHVDQGGRRQPARPEPAPARRPTASS